MNDKTTWHNGLGHLRSQIQYGPSGDELTKASPPTPVRTRPGTLTHVAATMDDGHTEREGRDGRHLNAQTRSLMISLMPSSDRIAALRSSPPGCRRRRMGPEQVMGVFSDS
jgi:hypothetical protein